jgi:hypothetical protein
MSSINPTNSTPPAVGGAGFPIGGSIAPSTHETATVAASAIVAATTPLVLPLDASRFTPPVATAASSAAAAALELSELSEKDLSKLLGSYAKDGNLEGVQRILASSVKVSQEALEDAVSLAVSQGYVEIVRLILSEGRTISKGCLEFVIKKVAAKGHQVFVRFLLSEERTISEECLGKAVEFAAELGHVEVVRILLSEGRTISERVWKLVFEEVLEDWGYKGNRSRPIEILLPHMREIPDRRGLILRSAREGWTAVLIALLERGPVDRALQEFAITNAANDTVRDILRSAPIIAKEEPAS